MKLKKTLSLLLSACAVLTALAGCGGDGGEDTQPSVTTKTTAEDVKVPYNREAENLNGYEFDVLHVKDNFWATHTDFFPETLDGQAINKAVYNRNEMIQDDYDCVFVLHNDVDYDSMKTKINQVVYSGSCPYDASYVEGNGVAGLISSGFLENLCDFDELQLNEEWWSQLVNSDATLGSGKYQKLFFTQSNLSLTAFDLTWCIFFNKDIHASFQMEDIYADVRDGSWTLAKMKELSATAASLNGDESFSYNLAGNAVYGTSGYYDLSKALMFGAGATFVQRNSDGDFEEAPLDETFVNICSDVAKFFATRNDGAYTYGATPNGASDYITIFTANRALFMGGEVKSSVTDFKDFEGFGILPVPKYSSESGNYISWVFYRAPLLTIPKQTEDPHKAALLLDVLSYYSERDVLPVYYNTVLRGRGAQDADSYEMLEVINKTRYFTAGISYGWSEQMVEVMGNLLFQGNSESVGAQPATYKGIIAEKIKNTMDKIFGEE